MLAGQAGPIRDVVLLNAAAALVAEAGPTEQDLVGQFRRQLARAAGAVDSGAAGSLLDRWIAATQAAADSAG